MYASASILIFGPDAILLETRRLILERAGFKVWIAIEATQALQVLVREPIDLFILGQSLSPCEYASILKRTHALRPDMGNLVLGGTTAGAWAGKRDAFLTTFSDPRALVAFIQDKISAETVRTSFQ